LSAQKKRPVLIVKDENSYGDFVCFQITSNGVQLDIEKIVDVDLASGSLKLISFVKYDKCFTINSSIVEKKLATASADFLAKIKKLFCESI
jgi:mRNA-degrading endonuclease toxin of MazEF toxin-antitoxin module